VFTVVNSLKQLQILVTNLTSFSDPIMQIILTYMCLNRTVGNGVEGDFIWLYIYLQWKVLIRLFEIYMVAIHFPVTCRHYFAFHKSEFGGSSEIWVKLVTRVTQGLYGNIYTFFCHQQKYFSANVIYMHRS
jgi:hypothetical protein